MHLYEIWKCERVYLPVSQKSISTVIITVNPYPIIPKISITSDEEATNFRNTVLTIINRTDRKWRTLALSTVRGVNRGQPIFKKYSNNKTPQNPRIYADSEAIKKSARRGSNTDIYNSCAFSRTLYYHRISNGISVSNFT